MDSRFEDDDPYFTRRENLDISRHLTAAQIGRNGWTAGHFRRDAPDLGVTDPTVHADCVMAVINLRPRDTCEMWCDERHMVIPSIAPGDLKVLDQRRTWVARLDQPFESMNFFIPLQAFDDLADQWRAPRLDSFRLKPETPAVDEVLLHLSRSLEPAFANPRELSALYAEHVFTAILTRLASVHGGLAPGVGERRGVLANWQLTRIKTMLLDDLRQNLTLSDLAAACGLSVSYMSRGFRQAVGMPPHRWLLAQRVKRARTLIETTGLSLAEIALECGFADQSHLTRVFSKAVGAAPGAWRRARRH